MDIEGNLEMMDLPTLIQFIGQEGSEAVIQIKSDSKVGCIYLKSGLLCHAELTRNDEIEFAGEDVVYAMLGWASGRFKVEKEVESLASTIEQPEDFFMLAFHPQSAASCLLQFRPGPTPTKSNNIVL